MNLVRRVGTMSRAELAFRVRTQLHTQAQRARTALFGSSWDRRDAGRVIHSSRLDSALRSSITEGDWMTVERRLHEMLRGRPSRHVIDPASQRWLCDEIVRLFPEAPTQAVARADEVLANRYDLLGYRALSFADASGAINWHADPVHGRAAPMRFWADVPYLEAACGDHKVIWELNRHQHFLTLGRALWLTGDRRYAERIRREVESWLAANPPLIGINWSSMLELALRSLSWVAAIHFLLVPDADTNDAGTPWLLDTCLALDRQLRHVERNLSRYFSPNTHLTGEALALYVAGVALPELAGSDRWVETGRAVLLQEAGTQICSDGGHIERSTHYHRYTLDYYTLAWLTAARAGDRESAEAFGRAVERLAVAMRAFADPNGWIPLVGDDDGGMLWPITGRDPRDVRDSLAVAAALLDRADLAPWDLPEEVFWIAGRRPATPTGGDAPRRVARDSGIDVQLLPESGFVTARTGRGDHLVFDVGPHGFRNGGHAHADALSIVLGLEGQPLLVDPGTATYTVDRDLRDRMRSSRSHNTVSLDGRSAAVPAGPFHWRSTADARLDRARGNVAFLWAQASHAGYAPVTVRRHVIYAGGVWLVIDAVDDATPHVAEAFWHFDVAWQLRQEAPARVAARTDDGRRAWLVTDCPEIVLTRGDRSNGLGWCSPRYGSIVPIWTARVIQPLSSGSSMVTCIGPGSDAPALCRLDAGGAMAGVSIRLSRHSETLWTWLRNVGDAGDGGLTVAGDLRTDAALLQVGIADGRESHVSMADGTYVVPSDPRAPGLWCERPVEDLHVRVAGERLDAWSSASPGRVRFRAAGVRRIRLNGREHWFAPDEDGTVTVAASEWSSHAPRELPDGIGVDGAEAIVAGGRVARPSGETSHHGERVGSRSAGARLR